MNRTENHFDKWFKVYDRYIQTLWDIYLESMNDYLKLPVKCSYDQFVDFVYNHSSGYISEFA